MNKKFMSKEEAFMLQNSSPALQLYGVGDRLKAVMDAAGSVGEVYYLDPTNGDDSNAGRLGAPVKALAAGYALLRDGCNDCLVYVPGSGSVSLAAGFTWAKSYAHFVGACSPTPFSPRSRLFLAAAAAAQPFLFKVTGQGCCFLNLLFFMGVADNTAAHAVVVTGGRNWFKGCHFAGIGHLTMDVAGAGSLQLDGAEENLFEDCTVGLDTVARTTSTHELEFKNAAVRNTFRRCTFVAYVAAAGHALAEVTGATGIDRVQKFEGCHFIADSLNQAVALTSVFKIPAISQGMIDLDVGCHVSSWGAAAAWDSSSRGIISAAMVAPTAAGAGGISTHK
jgi:hypothetical protein